MDGTIWRMLFFNILHLWKISFGGIPNSSSIDIPCGQSYPRDQNNHMAAPVKVARQQTTPELSGTLRNLPNPASGTYTNTRRNSSEPSGTIQTLPPEPTPTRAGTLQNPPEPSETFRNQPFGTFGNLPPEPTPAYTGTLQNLPELASGTYTILHRNSPEPSGTCLRNLHQHTPELSGTFQNLPPEPAPATRTGTHRSLSGLKTPLAYAVGEKCLKVWFQLWKQKLLKPWLLICFLGSHRIHGMALAEIVPATASSSGCAFASILGLKNAPQSPTFVWFSFLEPLCLLSGFTWLVIVDFLMRSYGMVEVQEIHV